jgi:hypothetical protein
VIVVVGGGGFWITVCGDGGLDVEVEVEDGVFVVIAAPVWTVTWVGGDTCTLEEDVGVLEDDARVLAIDACVLAEEGVVLEIDVSKVDEEPLLFVVGATADIDSIDEVEAG